MKLEFLPFGGFEYLDRLYVRVSKEDYGAVYAYSRGIPPAWALRLHEESIARVADNVRGLFRLLFLKRNLSKTSPDDFPSGLDASEAITAARSADKLAPSDADRMEAILVSAVADWHQALDRGTLSAEPRLARLALEHAAETGDGALLQRLERAGIDLARPLLGGGTLLDHALLHDHVDLPNTLLDWGMQGGTQTFQCVPVAAGPDLLHRLYRAGARPSLYAAMTAARAAHLDNAELQARWLIEQDPSSREALQDACEEGARSADQSADRIECGQMGSNITAAGYREEARNLRALAARLRAL